MFKCDNCGKTTDGTEIMKEQKLCNKCFDN